MQDNTSTITSVKDGGGQYRTKYMRVRQGFVKERLDAGEIDIKYLRTTGMLADYLTKPLQGELYRDMTRATMGMKASRHRGALTESSLFNAFTSLLYLCVSSNNNNKQEKNKNNVLW